MRGESGVMGWIFGGEMCYNQKKDDAAEKGGETKKKN